MSKYESKMVQGLAVLLMLFFHLFNGDAAKFPVNDSTKQLFQELFGNSMLQHLALVHNPVPFFVLISGYALFTLRQRGEDKHRFSRLGRLYVRYWYVLIPFLLLDYWLGVCRCDLSLNPLLLNAAGVITSYNAVCWFILPYCILAVSAKWLFGSFFKQHTLTALLMGYGVYVVMAYLTRYPFYQSNALQCFYILFPFLLGGALARYHVVEVVSDKMKHYPCVLPYILLVLWVVLRYFVSTGAFIAVYAAGVIVILMSCRRPAFLDKSLHFFGRHSTNLWFIHPWWCWYLFPDFIYGFRNPVLIMLVLLAVCILCSLLLDYVKRLVEKGICLLSNR